MKWLRDLNLVQKYILFLLTLSVIPLLMVGAVGYNVAYSLFKTESQRTTQHSLADQTAYFDLYFSQVNSVMTNIVNTSVVQRVVEGSNHSTSAEVLNFQQQELRVSLQDYLSLEGLTSVDFYSAQGEHYHVGEALGALNTRSDLRDALMVKALQSHFEETWSGVEHNPEPYAFHHHVLTTARVLLRPAQIGAPVTVAGVLVVTHDLTMLMKHISEVYLGENAILTVFDAQNTLVYSNNAVMGDYLAHLPAADLYPALTWNGEGYQATQATGAQSGWRLICLLPVANFVAKTMPIAHATQAAVIVCLLLVIFTALFISRGVVQPIKAITDQFKLLEQGNAQGGKRLTGGMSGEISELITWFNTFMDNMVSARMLRASEERYELAANAAFDGLWDWNLETGDFYLSARWKAVLGYKAWEIKDSPLEWFNRVLPEDQERLQIAIRDHVEGKTTLLENEHRMLHKDGSYRWMLARGVAARDSRGVAYRMAGSHTDITDRKQAEEKLRHDALHDALTGLPNRILFLDRLERAFLRLKRYEKPLFAVLFLDFDRFKDVNDTLGHDVGDQLLMESAERLLKVVRTVDTVARQGGDEFVILLEEITSIYDATQIAARIQEEIGAPFLFNGHIQIISASIGIVMGSQQYETVEDILRDADIAMYQAKAAGRACYQVFDVGMREQVLARVVLEGDLRQAVKDQQMFLQYQPIMDMSQRCIVGFEALVRWLHPLMGVLPPDKFIPIAEETGLILPMGLWILHEACRQGKAWQAQYGSAFTMSVNLSAVQLACEALPQQVMEILAETGFCADHLVFEVTESAIVRDVRVANERLTQLKAMGAQIHMDDFGTGYSSLSNLRAFPIDAIKIDRSFVAGLNKTNQDVGMVHAIVMMAHELGIQAVAEGIETGEQYNQIEALGCEFGQGYFIARPLSIAATEALLAGRVGSSSCLRERAGC